MPEIDSDAEKLELDRQRLALEKDRLALERDKLALELEKHARERWWQEDKLVDQRLRWLLTSQGLLGAGYAYLQQTLAGLISSASGTLHPRPILGLIWLANFAPMLGLLMCVSLFAGLQAALSAQQQLQRIYMPLRLGVSTGTLFFGHATARVVPALFSLFWAVALWAFWRPV